MKLWMALPVLKESRSLRYFSFFYLYVMQGIPSGFALTAVSNYLTAKGLSSYSVGSFVAIVGLPGYFNLSGDLLLTGINFL